MGFSYFLYEVHEFLHFKPVWGFGIILLFIVGGLLNNPYLFVPSGIAIMITCPVIFGAVMGPLIARAVWRIHLSRHGNITDAHSVEKEFANKLPSFAEMTFRITTATLGIVYAIVFGAGFFPEGITDAESLKPNFFPLFMLSSGAAVGINFGLWLLESAGATCKEKRLGRINIGADLSRSITRVMGISALLHFGMAIIKAQGDMSGIEGGLFIIAVVGAASAAFSAFIIKKYIFDVVSWHIQQDIATLAEKYNVQRSMIWRRPHFEISE